MPVLRLFADGSGGQARELSVGAPEVRIGRASDNQVVVTDAAASRHHARIVLAQDGYVLLDEGSENGTWIGESRIARCRLSDGLVFRIGGTLLQFCERSPDLVETVEREVPRAGMGQKPAPGNLPPQIAVPPMAAQPAPVPPIAVPPAPPAYAAAPAAAPRPPAPPPFAPPRVAPAQIAPAQVAPAPFAPPRVTPPAPPLVAPAQPAPPPFAPPPFAPPPGPPAAPPRPASAQPAPRVRRPAPVPEAPAAEPPEPRRSRGGRVLLWLFILFLCAGAALVTGVVVYFLLQRPGQGTGLPGNAGGSYAGAASSQPVADGQLTTLPASLAALAPHVTLPVPAQSVELPARLAAEIQLDPDVRLVLPEGAMPYGMPLRIAKLPLQLRPLDPQVASAWVLTFSTPVPLMLDKPATLVVRRPEGVSTVAFLDGGSWTAPAGSETEARIELADVSERQLAVVSWRGELDADPTRLIARLRALLEGRPYEE